MSPTNGQKSNICAPLCCSDETQSLFFASVAFYLSNMKKCLAEAALCCLKSFKFSGVNQHCLPALQLPWFVFFMFSQTVVPIPQ